MARVLPQPLTLGPTEPLNSKRLLAAVARLERDRKSCGRQGEPSSWGGPRGRLEDGKVASSKILEQPT